MGKSLKGHELGIGITQRADGRYQVRVSRRGGGRRTAYAKTIKEARELSRKMQQEEDFLSVTDVTLEEWFEEWIRVFKCNCRNTSIVVYRSLFNRIRYLGKKRLVDLDLITLQEALLELPSDHARKETRVMLVEMFNRAVENDLLQKNVAKSLKYKIDCKRKAERRVLTEVEVAKFKAGTRGTHYDNLFILALNTGMRIGELRGLTWGDINLDGKYLIVSRNLVCFGNIIEFHNPKTENGVRKIPLTKEAISCLERQRLKNKQLDWKFGELEGEYKDLVFRSPRNKPIHADNFRESLAKLCIKCDIEVFTPHTLRHTFATRCIEQGMRPKTLQRILGHADITTTMNLYCHVSDEALFTEMENVSL